MVESSLEWRASSGWVGGVKLPVYGRQSFVLSVNHVLPIGKGATGTFLSARARRGGESEDGAVGLRCMHHCGSVPVKRFTIDKGGARCRFRAELRSDCSAEVGVGASSSGRHSSVVVAERLPSLRQDARIEVCEIGKIGLIGPRRGVGVDSSNRCGSPSGPIRAWSPGT